MNDPLRVKLLQADKDGCGFYRMEEPGRVAALEGVEITMGTDIPAEVGLVEGHEGYVHRLGKGPEVECDVVVIQRAARKRVVEYIPEFQRRGIAVVIEIDDDLSALAHHHPNKAAFDGRVDPEVHWKNLMRAAQVADLVTVTSQALADRYAPHGRVAILPNCVPERILNLPRKSDGHTIGWTGAIFMHPDDLQTTFGGVGQALAQHPDWRFLKVGGGAEIVQRGLHLPARPDQTGPLSMADYHAEIGLLDIGIAPLAPTRFNDGKSYLKLIEYGAFGIPCLASPSPEYQLCASEGLGMIVKDKGRSWKSAVNRLITDENLRTEMGDRARDIVAAEHTYEGNGWRWVEAWQQALDNRRSA